MRISNREDGRTGGEPIFFQSCEQVVQGVVNSWSETNDMIVKDEKEHKHIDLTLRLTKKNK